MYLIYKMKQRCPMWGVRADTNPDKLKMDTRMGCPAWDFWVELKKGCPVWGVGTDSYPGILKMGIIKWGVQIRVFG